MTFVASCLLAAVCLPSPSQQVAFVDLTIPPKTPETITSTVRASGGGLYDHGGPAPGTPTISVKLLRVTTYKEGQAARDAVEVEVTNRGAKEISVPVGADPNSSLAPGQQDRQYLWISVQSGDDLLATVASARAATSRAHAESIVLHNGESVVFRLPFDKSGWGVDRAKSAGESPELRASVTLWRVMVRDGEDWNVQVGDPIKSENALWRR
jgi:hypothetical protein